jgi:DNA-binding LacI/PurR family transcriptional regulator
MNPPLTAVSIAHYETGVEAAGLLLDTIEGPDRTSAAAAATP